MLDESPVFPEEVAEARRKTGRRRGVVALQPIDCWRGRLATDGALGKMGIDLNMFVDCMIAGGFSTWVIEGLIRVSITFG
jgi:hypothetical protein